MSDSNQQENIQEQAGADSEAHAAADLPGRRLRETRENMHLSREEVAHHLRLDAQLITALEQDDYSRLPSPAYICGYLRSYARLLKLPEDEIVQAYSHGEQINSALIPSSVNIQPQKPVNTALLKTIIIIVIVLLLGGGIYFVIDKYKIFSGKSSSTHVVTIQQHSELTVPPAPKTITDKTNTSAPATSQPQASAPAEVGEQKPAPVTVPAKPVTGKTMVEKLPTPKTKIPASEPGVPSAPAASNASGSTNTSVTTAGPSTAATQANQTPAATAVLRMHFTDNSWVEVSDSTNKRLVYRLVEKGTDLNLDGVPPFTILLGNAPAVQVFYKGKEFDHTNYHRDQVAYFKVGAKQTNTNQ